MEIISTRELSRREMEECKQLYFALYGRAIQPRRWAFEDMEEAEK